MNDCPSDDRLSALAAGTLPAPELEALEKHLDGCTACRQLVAVVSNGSAPTTKHEFGVLRAGEKLGRYEIERLIGAGGMGVLYVARDPQLNRRVALKLMRPAFAAEGGSVRLRREAQAMATLAHPNVVNVFDIGEAGERVFMAMELLEGGTLREWMKQPHSWKELLAMFCDAGEGLAAAHAAGVVHRDFKPENVLIGKDGRPRVGDFGLARPELVAQEELPRALAVAHHAMRVTHTGTLLGTPAYMSPEQLRGRPADHRSDQYGFCVCLYEALVGQRPFPADTLEELRARVEGGMPPPPRDGLVPAHVWAAIARGLNPRPNERFPDMHALLTVLRFDAPKVIAPRAAEHGPWSRRRELRLGAAVLSLALIGAGVFVRTNARTPAEVAAAAGTDPLANSGVIVLARGARKAISAPGLSSVSIDHAHLVKVEQNGTMLLFDGLEVGKATLTITNTNGSTYQHQVRVEAQLELPQTTALQVGHQQVLTVPNLVRVAVGDPAIVDVNTIGDDQVVLIGASAGSTTLLVWTRDGEPASTVVKVSAATAEGAGDVTRLGVGQATTLRFPGLRRIAVGDPSIADVKTVGSDELVAIGASAGKTTLLVWTNDGSRRALTLEVGGDVANDEAATQLSVGEQKVLQFPGLQRIAVGDPAIVDVKTIGDGEVLLVGGAAGRTTLLVWTADGARHKVNLQVASADVPIRSVVLSAGATASMKFPAITSLRENSHRPCTNVASIKQVGTSLEIVARARGSCLLEVSDGKTSEDVKIVVEKAVDPAAVPDVITLRPKDLAEFHVPGLTRVAIGDPSVADVKIAGDERVRIDGVAAGTTTLFAWMKDGSRRSWSIQIK
ncbi:MAG: pilus assembly protein N-terminal domain-containing protein [Archangium sp.]|nr:pilus assembly protein N-terminal domain-containing protein [Archangium sp.]